MSEHQAAATAEGLLKRLQSVIDEKDLTGLSAMFDDAAVLVGPTAHSTGRQAIDDYLSADLAAPEIFRWEWRDIAVFHEAPRALGFASFGEVVLTGPDGENRAPFRLTAFAVEGPEGWRFQQFHGSIPSDF